MSRTPEPCPSDDFVPTEELVRRQGLKPINSVDDLAAEVDPFESDEEHEAFLAELVVLPSDQHVATRRGEIQTYAQLRGRPRPANGSWIAACCLVRGLPLARFNIKDYAAFAEHEGLELVQ